jgi:hypothetical protein
MARINLVGGLGNQLFQYYAGLYLVNGDSEKLSIDSTFSLFGRTGHYASISGLGLPGKFIETNSENKVLLSFAIFRRHWEKTLARASSYFRFLTPKARWFKSEVVGFDPILNPRTVNANSTIWGFFQTWRYSKSLIDRGCFPMPHLENPSDWYQLQLGRQQLGKTLVIHVRRGDYSTHDGSIGLLSADYYSRAIANLRKAGAQWVGAWIYSDEPDTVEVEFAQLIEEENLKVVRPPEGSHPGESLLAMTEAEFLIVGNSSFSWWSAFLSVRAEKIVRPEKWFRGLSDPVDLFPSHWMPVASSWNN